MHVLADVACSVLDIVSLVHFCSVVEDEHSDSKIVVCLAVAAAEAT